MFRDSFDPDTDEDGNPFFKFKENDTTRMSLIFEADHQRLKAVTGLESSGYFIKF